MYIFTLDYINTGPHEGDDKNVTSSGRLIEFFILVSPQITTRVPSAAAAFSGAFTVLQYVKMMHFEDL